MSILMYDSINQQSVENLLGPQDGGKTSSRTMGFCVPLRYLYDCMFSYFSCLGLNSQKHKLTLTYANLFSFFLVWWSLTLLPLSHASVCSYQIIHFFLSSFLSSHFLPSISPLVYWFSRLRIPRVTDCNTQASNYFGVCLFAFPLHLFGLCL